MQPSSPISIFWLRRDLRLDDNHGLYRALKSGFPVLAVYIFEKSVLSNLADSDARIEFVLNSLNKIKEQLEEIGSSLEIFIDSPIGAWDEIISKYNVQKVFGNSEYEPEKIRRDEDVKQFLNSHQISFSLFKDHVITEKNEVVDLRGKAFLSFDRYEERWRNIFELESYSSEKLLNKFVKISKFDVVNLDSLGLKPSLIKIPEINLTSSFLMKVEKSRDSLPSPYSSSKLSVHLRFGTVSIRKYFQMAKNHNLHYLMRDLIYRDFLIQSFYHFPQTEHVSFKPSYEKINWKNDLELYKKWIEGNTGYPLVDAAMRELNATGFIHYQSRLLVASFLCKNLHISWKWGERYFAKKLLDADLALNVGNWQNVAGNGIDAQPYFKIINPKVLSEKIDPINDYVKKWVPEYKSLNYKPIVDFNQSRNECFNMYKKALISNK